MPSEEKKEIWAKIALVQQEIGALSKSKENPFFKSSYFDINDVIENLLPLLEKHELVVIQPLTHVDGQPAIKTKVVSLTTDEWVEETTILPSKKAEKSKDGIPVIGYSNAQEMGSAITYYRRYALQSFFLLQAKDDDGNKASGRKDPLNLDED